MYEDDFRTVKEITDDLQFVKSNIHTLYNWTCSMEDQLGMLKRTLEQMKKRFE